MARHDKRLRLAELRRVVKAVERQGVSHRPAAVEMAALVALVDARLSKRGAGGPSARVMALLAGLQDKSNSHAPGMDRVVCKAGCHCCCEVYVSAQAPCVFAIAGWLRANSPDLKAEIARLEAAGPATRGLDAEAWAARGLACAFLGGGECRIYPVRPAACRGMFSLSVEACAGEGGEIPVPPHIHPLRGAYEQALSAALWHWRLPADHYELAHGVLVALDDAGAEARWYDGEDVLAGVAIDRADEAMDPEIKRLEGEFWRTLWSVAHGAPPAGVFADRFPDW